MEQVTHFYDLFVVEMEHLGENSVNLHFFKIGLDENDSHLTELLNIPPNFFSS